MNIPFLKTWGFLVFFFPLLSMSQPAVWSPAGASTAATAGTQAGISGSFWGLFGNPAGMIGIGQLTIGSHVEQRFSIREMSAAQIGVVSPIRENQAFGARVSWFGLGNFGEGRYAISYSIEPLEKFRIGTSFNIYQSVIPSQGSGQTIFADVGLQYDVTSNLTLGMFAVNANRARLRNLGEGSPLPTLLQAGLSFKASEEVTLMADISQEVAGPLSLRAGMQYQPTEILIIRAGVRTGPSAVSAGFGLKFDSLLLDVSADYIPLLGFSPHIGLIYQFRKDEA